MLHALIGRRAAGSPAPTPLRIHSLGQFRLLLGDGDLAPALISRRIKGYMWLCLLARHALQPGVGFTRGILADEAFPGLPARTQRERLRKRLSELQLSLPPALAACIRVEGEFVGIDLSGCEFDVDFVQGVAREVLAVDRERLPDRLIGAAERAVELARGEFLPLWEEVQRRAGGRGGANDIVAAVRNDLAVVQCRLLVALGDHYRSQRRHEQAITFLEEALQRRPDLPLIAPKLVRCYREIGDARRASVLVEEYGLHEAS
jgi:hypothetical protein